MTRRTLLAAALFLIAGCATSGTQHRTASDSNADLPAYELMKDDAVFESNGAHFKLTLSRCGVKKGMNEADIDQTCILDMTQRSLPDTDLVSGYCDSLKDDFIEEVDCLIMASFAVDLVRLAGSPEPQAFVSDLPSKYGDASGRAAIFLAKSIWQKCPDGPDAALCRVAEAAARLQTTPEEQSRCEALPEDRKIVSCMIIARFVHRMYASTEKMKGL